MRLGVVLTGIGACAAASAGALTWLLDAGVAPYAVCGMQAAAWPAALYLVGYDADRLRGAAVQAARAGRRTRQGKKTAARKPLHITLIKNNDDPWPISCVSRPRVIHGS